MTTIFEEEIRSQGGILRRRSDVGRTEAQRVAEAWRGISFALVAARGSSDNAARFFQYFAGQELGLLVSLAAPSLFEGGRHIGLDGAGVLAISQSGRTPGILQIIEQAQRQHRPNAVITNDQSSPLAAQSDHLIELDAGPERAIASTKTFSTTWQALAQLVEALKGETLVGLAELPDLVDRAVEWSLSASLPIAPLNAETGLTIIGRGIGLAVAAEISLKIREVTGIRSEAYSVADYLHGPIGADAEGAALLLVLTEEMSDDLSESLMSECRQFGMRTVVIRPPDRAPLTCDHEIVLPESASNWCVGLTMVIVGQVLALRLGELRGRPIDTSPGLHKVTLSA
jgi:glucosamine--fructose-6-phosphate aminotransferase (isomerizing)